MSYRNTIWSLEADTDSLTERVLLKYDLRIGEIMR